MSSKGGCTAPPPPSYGGATFCNPPEVRHQKQMLLKKHQEMIQKQQQQQQLLQREAAVKTAGEEAEKESEIDSSSAVDFCLPTSVSNVTNLDRLMESVTPYITATSLSQLNAREWTREVDSHSYFCLEDLWVSFKEWSVCGAGVPLQLNGKDPIVQYYVPFLSGLQLYGDPSKPSSPHLRDCEADIANSPRLIFQFLENEQPRYRRPLTDKISALESQYPELSKCRSCDLLPTSWICVAWYPIYRIPIGPTLRDLDACFLTFHSLSTQSRSKLLPHFHAANTRKVCGVVDPMAKISLPVFALASYKLKGSIVSPCGPHECDQENSLLQAADEWLRHLQVILPDYQFFHGHCSQWR